MIKKAFTAIGIATIIVVVQSFIVNPSAVDTGKGAVHWYTFSEAVEMQKIKPKPIMVDVYTQWCGPCRMMSANTFGNELIADYLNEKFYPVKFDAETYDSVAFKGAVFKNNNPLGTPRPVHDFANSILDGKLVYPSIVFLSEDIQRIQIITGYYKPDQFEPIIKFFGSGSYKTTPFDDFQKTFITEIK